MKSLRDLEVEGGEEVEGVRSGRGRLGEQIVDYHWGEHTMAKKTKTMSPIHPGETLREDFLKPLGLTVNRLSLELIVPASRVNDIVRGRRAITADTALRLARYFGTTPNSG